MYKKAEGVKKMGGMRYMDAIRIALEEEMVRDPNVIIYGEDIELGYVFQVTLGIREKFGTERVRDTPISEGVIVGSAVGAALGGIRPVPEIQMSDFMAYAMDQLANQAAKIRYMTGGQAKVPMTVRAPIGCVANFAAQHSQCMYAWYAHVPGLYVLAPSTPYDAKGLLKAAIRDDNPVVFLEHKQLYHSTGEVPDEEYVLPIGKADVKREGKDVTIVACSKMTIEALKAAETLSKEHGIEAGVVDLRSIVPLDFETIAQEVKKTGRLVIADEGAKSFGISAEIAARAADELIDYLDAPIIRVALPDVPIPFSTLLEDEVVPNDKDIVTGVLKAFE